MYSQITNSQDGGVEERSSSFFWTNIWYFNRLSGHFSYERFYLNLLIDLLPWNVYHLNNGAFLILNIQSPYLSTISAITGCISTSQIVLFIHDNDTFHF